jgi:hypothetical protein
MLQFYNIITLLPHYSAAVRFRTVPNRKQNFTHTLCSLLSAIIKIAEPPSRHLEKSHNNNNTQPRLIPRCRLLEYCVDSRHLAVHRATTSSSRATFKFRLFLGPPPLYSSNISSNIYAMSDPVTSSNIAYTWIKFCLSGNRRRIRSGKQTSKIGLDPQWICPVLNDVFVRAGGQYGIRNRKTLNVMWQSKHVAGTQTVRCVCTCRFGNDSTNCTAVYTVCAHVGLVTTARTDIACSKQR